MAIDILDTHQHLIYTDRFTYGWTAGIPALADKAFTYDDYQQAAGGGIARALFMEAGADDPLWREETHMVSAMADDPGNIVTGVIANCRPEDEAGFPAWLEEIADLRVVGLRRICHTEPDALSQSTVFVDNVRRLAVANLVFDLCLLARQLPLAADLARACPDVQFVLDHCGVPNIAGGAMDPWRDHITALAALPNVACKISGVIAYTAPGEGTVEVLRPWISHCIEAFGWDRVVWGSDWPVCNMNSDLATWIAHSRTLVADEDPANQAKLFHQNAARLYRV